MQTLKGTNPVDPNYVTLAQKQKDIKDNLKTAASIGGGAAMGGIGLKIFRGIITFIKKFKK